MRKHSRRWVQVSAVVLAVALLAAVLLFFHRQPVNVVEDVAVISVDGREWLRVPLSQPQTVTIEQDGGLVNVVEVTADGAVMRSSTCDNQLCVHMGAVTRENIEWRVNGAFIICLPNRVTVELVLADPP